jgi:hypothetical protein
LKGVVGQKLEEEMDWKMEGQKMEEMGQKLEEVMG